MSRWSPEARERQAELCRQQKPWLDSTGPTSEYGRRVSSRNAKKYRSQASKDSNVSFVSQQIEGDIDQPLQIGDRVTYIGGYEATMLACGDETLEVIGFDGSAIACRAVSGKLIWIYPQDLQRCLDGQRKHD